MLSHLGPGLTNASTGVANAALDSIPMVVIAGDIPSHYYGKHPHQEINLHADASQSEIYRPFAKRVWRVERPDLFPGHAESGDGFFGRRAQVGRLGERVADDPRQLRHLQVQHDRLDLVEAELLDARLVGEAAHAAAPANFRHVGR